MATYLIGALEFLTFPYPAEAFRRNMTEIEVRAGVDDQSIWVNGMRGRPMDILAVRDFDTLENAALGIEECFALIGTSVEITWADVTFPRLFDILDCRPGNENGGIRRIIGGVGGVEGTSTAMLEVVFTIIESSEAVPP